VRAFVVLAVWSSPVARQAHNLKAASSNLATASTSPLWRAVTLDWGMVMGSDVNRPPTGKGSHDGNLSP
jgi:hypothetical protein